MEINQKINCVHLKQSNEDVGLDCCASGPWHMCRLGVTWHLVVEVATGLAHARAADPVLVPVLHVVCGT